nr:thiopeptide-type bacteriocin biosynthesis protein [Streptomonospora nanhaiensis]
MQANVQFADSSTAEHGAVHHLAPVLKDTRWFTMRKRAWRCRIALPADSDAAQALRSRVIRDLDRLTDAGRISGWTRVVYEPETRAFGGAAAMEAAHTLFCADTRHLIRFLAAGGERPDRRREVSLLLCHTLLRAAELDPFEQGDVWDRVAATRVLPSGAPPSARIQRQVHGLLSVEPGPAGPHFADGGAFAGFSAWAQSFQTCGQRVAALNAGGRLTRGLRAVLAHHVIFHWNRLGIVTEDQAVLAHAAARTAFAPETAAL